MHYRTAPKFKLFTILKYHMDIFMLHSLFFLYSFKWLFSIYPSQSYDFTLKKFPACYTVLMLLKIKGSKLEL
jgi:hypothetical protein